MGASGINMALPILQKASRSKSFLKEVKQDSRYDLQHARNHPAHLRVYHPSTKRCGLNRNPPLHSPVKEGDVFEVEIEGIGVLENKVLTSNQCIGSNSRFLDAGNNFENGLLGISKKHQSIVGGK